MFPEALLNSPLLGIGLTVIVYVFSEALINRFNIRLLPPFVLACPAIILMIMYSPALTYEKYKAGADFINFLLGPATIALALPLYRNRHIISANAGAISIGILTSAVTAIVSIYFIGKTLGTSEQVLISMIPKSVTTPIAMEVSNTIGGIPALTAACVIFTGVLGAIMNHKLLALFGFKNDMAKGLAIGASSHGVGTSACVGVSNVQLALGGVAIALAGIVTSILAPILLPILKSIY